MQLHSFYTGYLQQFITSLRSDKESTICCIYLLQVGSGESYGNDDVEYDEDEEQEEDDEGEYMEDWKTYTSTQNNWTGIHYPHAPHYQS